MVENFMEGYHNNRLHHDLYDVERGDDPDGEGVLGGHMDFEYRPGDGIIAGRATTSFRDRGLNPTQRATVPTGRHADRRRTLADGVLLRAPVAARRPEHRLRLLVHS